MYYTKGFGWDHVSPDVFVTFDVEPGDRDKWETWNEGDRFADVVFEITSPSTIEDDLGKKRRFMRAWVCGNCISMIPSSRCSRSSGATDWSAATW